jgi:MtN3 and saliva related transmembrane protein
MNWTTVLGLVAGMLTTLMVLPQLQKTWKTKEVEDISLVTFVSVAVGVTLWAIYGVFKQDIALIITNAVSLLLNLIMIGLKLRYRNN